MKRSAPSIDISPGWKIGYQSRGLFSKRQSLELVAAGGTIALHQGLHLLAARNGRGKSTLMRTLAGLQRPLAGEAKTRGRMQYVGEGLRFDAELSAGRIFAAMLSAPRREFATRLAGDLELELGKPYGKLSKGNQQKVHIVVAEAMSHGSPGDILLLDEPISNLDYHVRMRLNEYWKANASALLRIICLHELEWAPEWESLLLISQGKLTQIYPQALNLESLYHQLN